MDQNPDPHQIQIERQNPDLDPHQYDKLDPDPRPHQMISWIWIRIRIKVQMTSQTVRKMSLFEHFFKVLSLYLEARIRIQIKVKGRIRILIRIKVTSRIRICIRINMMPIRNIDLNRAMGSYEVPPPPPLFTPIPHRPELSNYVICYVRTRG